MEAQQKKELSELKGDSQDIAWGNQIRSYVLHPYKLIKDQRSKKETANVQAVLDGDLDEFIHATLCLKKL